MKTTQNIKLFKQKLTNLNLDYFLLPNSDEFSSEYLPEHAKRLEFITGFTGSSGFAIIAQNKAKKSAFFTDGRYTIQASQEVDSNVFEIYNFADKLPLSWLLDNALKNSQIGFDPLFHNINSIKNYQKYFGENLVALEKNPVDSIWEEQPDRPQTKIFKHQIKYCGISSKDKIKKIIGDLDKNIDALILNDSASICWLFNIRASDIKYSPLLLKYVVIYKDGSSEFFHNNLPKLSKIKKIQLDFNQANYWFYQLLGQRKITIINKTNPCLIHKAIKNSVEIKNAILAHKMDGLAVTKFLFWLDKSLKQKQKIDELSATKKLLEFRKANKKFLYPSFATIAGFGSNGAIVHYHSSLKTNKTLEGNSLFLIDSGGQYLEGTTDITRTVAVGKPSAEMIKNFTRVLKGHIALALAKFPRGTIGNNLDAIARYHLWQDGLNYDHGTGHGVGSFSLVHESPPSISNRNDGVALQEGMILSNEPGYYKAGEYGIRIENLMLVKEAGNGFLEFQTLTLAPIDHNLIDFTMLDDREKKWLKNYHLEVYKKLKDGLSKEELNWLRFLTGLMQN